MKSDLAIATLIRSRMTELGLSRGEFAKRLGYKNVATDALCEVDLEGMKVDVAAYRKFVRELLRDRSEIWSRPLTPECLRIRELDEALGLPVWRSRRSPKPRNGIYYLVWV